MSEPPAKRSKSATKRFGYLRPGEKTTGKHKDYIDYREWFDENGSRVILDRWFKSSANFSGTRYNIIGDWVGFFDGETDWQDFEACLEQVPELAKLSEGMGASYVPIIRHCCHVSDPPVPLSVVKKLIEANPSMLQERIHHFINPHGRNAFRHNMGLLHVYIAAPTLVDDSWEISFDICELLVKAEPKLLFYKDSEGETGKSMLLKKFRKQGKKLLEELEKTIDLKALEKEVRDEEEKQDFEGLELEDY